MTRTEDRLRLELRNAIGSNSSTNIAEALHNVVKYEVAHHPWHKELCEAREMIAEFRMKSVPSQQQVDTLKTVICTTIQTLQDFCENLP